MRSGSFAQLYHPDQLVSGSEDAANNFARGFHTVGRIMKYTCENRIRKEFEYSDRVQGILIYRSLGGGTGSGMTATLFEILIEYAKTAKVEIPIHPSPHISCAVVEPYNSILSEHFCMDDVDISFLIDNEALYDILTNHIDITEPNMHNINRLVAQVISAVTASSRYENELYNDFSSLTNLVPYPRIHYPLVSYAPFGSEAKLARNANTVSELTQTLFEVDNQLVKCDPASGKYMSCSIVYRGNISPTDVFSTLSNIKSSRRVRFVDWCPTGFKVGIVGQPPQVLTESRLGYSDKSAVMMTNNSSVSSIWHRLAQKFHKLYAKRSFIHWFVSEGLEESEFCESLYNLATLAKDYEEVALDTKVEDFGGHSPQDGEGAMTPNAGEEGAASPEGNKDGAAGKESGGNDDDDDDEDGDDDEENENASNVSQLRKCSKNHNKSVDLCQQFETLLKSLYETEDLTTSKLKSNTLTEVWSNTFCNYRCMGSSEAKLKQLIDCYNGKMQTENMEPNGVNKSESREWNLKEDMHNNINNKLYGIGNHIQKKNEQPSNYKSESSWSEEFNAGVDDFATLSLMEQLVLKTSLE